jgi:hypothetical protein
VTVIVSPPVPKADQRFDDWMIICSGRRAFEAIAAGGGGGGGVPEYADNAAAHCWRA